MISTQGNWRDLRLGDTLERDPSLLKAFTTLEQMWVQILALLPSHSERQFLTHCASVSLPAKWGDLLEVGE